MRKTGSTVLSLAALLFVSLFFLLFSLRANARNLWESREGKWYYYVESDTATPEQYERKPYTGWVQGMADETAWYYVENSEMRTGWVIVDGQFYYLKAAEEGRMAQQEWVGSFYVGEDGRAQLGGETPDGVRLSQYGSRLRKGYGIEELNFKTARYIQVLREHPDAIIELTAPGQLVREPGNGKPFITFKTMQLYDRQSGEMLYSGDGCFDPGAVLERKEGDTVRRIHPMNLMEESYLMGDRIYISPAGFITGITQRTGE